MGRDLVRNSAACRLKAARQQQEQCMKNTLGFRLQFSTFCSHAAACLTALVLTCAAADAGNFDGPRWSLLDADQVLARAKETTTAKYPDSDQATVDKKMVRVYRSD